MRKSLITGLIICLATVSCFAWVVMKYYGSLETNVTADVERGEILLNGESSFVLNDLKAPILSSADGVNFFNEAGEKVTAPTPQTFSIKGADCDKLKVVSVEAGDDSLSDCIRVGLTYDGGGDVYTSSTANKLVGKLHSEATDMKLTVWLDGNLTTEEKYNASKGIPLKINFLAY